MEPFYPVNDVLTVSLKYTPKEMDKLEILNLPEKIAQEKKMRMIVCIDWFTTSEFSRLIERLKTLDVDVVISNYNSYYVETGETIPHPIYLDNYLIGRTGQTVDNRIRKKHIAAWAKTQNQAVEYCANHWDEIECDETSHYLTACLREWIHDTLVKFSYLPYKESKTYTKEWYSYYLQLSKVIPSESLMTHSIKAFLQLPFPFFWTYRRMLTIFAPPRKVRV